MKRGGSATIAKKTRQDSSFRFPLMISTVYFKIRIVLPPCGILRKHEKVRVLFELENQDVFLFMVENTATDDFYS